MSLIFWRKADGLKEAQVTEENPFPVSIMLGDPDGGAVEYVGDAAMPVLVTNPWPNIATIKRSFKRPADANAYAANDAFADSTSAPFAAFSNMLSNMARNPGGSGKITDAVVSMSAGTAFQGEVWIFDNNPAKTNDNAAFSVSDSDIFGLIGVIPFNTTDITAANAISYVQGLDIRFNCLEQSRDLYYLVKVIAAFTPGNAEVFGLTLKCEN